MSYSVVLKPTAALWCTLFVACGCSAAVASGAEADSPTWQKLAPFFAPPAEFAARFGDFRSPLVFDDGSHVANADAWERRRKEIRADWERLVGRWPALIDHPRIDIVESSRREQFTQKSIRLEVAGGMMVDAIVLVPDGDGPFPAVLVVYYDAQTSAGLKADRLRAFGYDLARRGFVTLSMGSPGGDARKPSPSSMQPLMALAYAGANAITALRAWPRVDEKRVGVVGHSYGGKWAMFTGCLDDRIAAAAWSDPGVVWDESRPNVNYWEPWYLGADEKFTRNPGPITDANPRTGAYKALRAGGNDLVELHALMAPRPFLVSGGAEDPISRWTALNHAVAVNKMLGFEHRVGMTSRPTHDPTPESNEAIYLFFEHFLMGK